MRAKVQTLLTVVGTVTVLVLAGNTVALATTGHGFLLGQANSTGKVTTLKRTVSGPALQVLTKSTANPPFAVNGKGKVANLNADTLDGYDSSSLRTRTYVFTEAVSTGTTDVTLTVPSSVPAGSYLVTYEAFLNGPVNDPLNEVECDVEVGNGTSSATYASTAFTTTGWFVGMSGSGVITKSAAPAASITLECQAHDPSTLDNATLTTPAGSPLQVTLTRIDQVG